MDFKNYDPARILGNWMGIELRGYAPGTMVRAERLAESVSMEPGTQGDVVRVMNRNRTGRVTINLLAASIVNDFLTAMIVRDEKFFDAYGPLVYTEVNGTTLIQATRAWLVKPADPEYADSAPVREWMFDCADLRILNGGSLV